MRNDGVLHPNEHKSKLFATMRPSSSLPHLDLNNYLLYIIPCHQIRNNFPNPLTSHLSINVITVPPKFWRRKPVNKYNPIIHDDVDEEMYVFISFGKSMTRSPHYTSCPRTGFILWGKFIDEVELLRGLYIRNNFDAAIRHNSINSIHDN